MPLCVSGFHVVSIRGFAKIAPPAGFGLIDGRDVPEPSVTRVLPLPQYHHRDGVSGIGLGSVAW